jgi:hypothetical protein
MGKGKSEAGAASVAEPSEASTTPAPPVNGLEDADLKDPLLQLVRTVIGPFVAHKPLCDVEPCTCGLTAAVGELQRREILVKRYGTVDG